MNTRRQRQKNRKHSLQVKEKINEIKGSEWGMFCDPATLNTIARILISEDKRPSYRTEFGIPDPTSFEALKRVLRKS